MFRIGRDNNIINFNKYQIKENDTIILVYGEVDCRCHIQRQINLGREEDTIIEELVSNYFRTIQNNVPENTNIIIVGIVPTTYKPNHETVEHYDPENMFPTIGTNENRVRYTFKVNKLLNEMANKNNYVYFNPYSYYTREDGTLKPELSDNNVHIGNNTYVLEKFGELYQQIHSQYQEQSISTIQKKLDMIFS
jgi:hypothetical protein